MFGGIGGFDLALTRNNWECVGYYEIDKYATSVYNKNFGTKYKPTDITTVNAKDIPDHEMLVGGFPCQSFSIAGKRKGFMDTRGTLFFDICRIVKEKRPKNLLLENVKGLLSHDNGRTFWTILASLNELGYNVEWQVFNSKHYVPQNRERVFIIGHLREKCSGKIFPFRQNPKAVSGLQEQAVNTLTARYEKGQATGSYIFTEDKQHAQTNERQEPTTVNTLTAGGHSGGHHSSMTLIHVNQKKEPIIYDRKGFDSRTKGFKESKINPTLSTKMGTRGNNVPMLEDIQSVNKILKKTGRLRRLTPTECERLQSFPDSWTETGDGFTLKKNDISDCQRYKQLGNAVTVNVVEEIIKKINEVMSGI